MAPRLADNLAKHNAACTAHEQIRLRMALHAGEVHQDAHGFTSTSLNLAFRLIQSPESRAALHDSHGILVLIVSNWFYCEVVRHYPTAEPECFREVFIELKETKESAWIRVLETTALRGTRTTAVMINVLFNASAAGQPFLMPQPAYIPSLARFFTPGDLPSGA